VYSLGHHTDEKGILETLCELDTLHCGRTEEAYYYYYYYYYYYTHTRR